MLFERSAGAVIFYRRKSQIKYLLLKHSDKYWNFPKGHMENGEGELDTARREIWEETGLKKLDFLPKFCATERYYYRLPQDFYRPLYYKKLAFKNAVFYLAEASQTKISISREHAGYGWFTFQEALGKLRYKLSRQTLTEADKFLHDYLAKKSMAGRQKNPAGKGANV